MAMLPYYAPYLPYNGFLLSGTSVIPKLNWDVYSQEQRIHAIVHELENLIKYTNDSTDALNRCYELLDKLQTQFDEFMASGFDDYYKDQVAKWIDDNLRYIF